MFYLHADDINHLHVDEFSGWTYKVIDAANPLIIHTSHTASKTWTYKFDNSFTNHINSTDYFIYVQNGIAMWGNSIDYLYDNSSNNEFFVVNNDRVSWAGLTSLNYNTNNDHIIHWKIYLNSHYFDDPQLMPITDTEKESVIAHEIGHTYGLGHVDYVKNGIYFIYPVMSLQNSTVLSIYDKAGMSVVTHQHKHDGPLIDPKYNFIHFTPINELQIENGSNTHHKIRCTVCFAYVEDEHEFVLKMNHGSHWFECDVEGCTKQVDFLSHHYDPNGECTVCGYSSCTHAWGPWTTVTTATCMQPGIEKSVCTLNGSHYQTRVNPVNANAHN